MKQKLFLLALLLFSALQGFSQATAYPVSDISQCGNELFDLTVAAPQALGNQNPSEYSVYYYTSMSDAENSMNAIDNPTSYVPGWGAPETIYARVTNIANGDFDITTFEITVGSAWVYDYDDQYVCTSFTLPAIEYGAYYTGPMGTGTVLPTGTVITTSSTIYIFAQDGDCTAQEDFTVYVGVGIPIGQPSPIEACDADGDGIVTVDLITPTYQIIGGGLDSSFSYYYTEWQAETGANPINADMMAYSVSIVEPVYVFVRIETEEGCFTVVPLTILEGDCTGNSISGTVVFNMEGSGCEGNSVPAAGVQVYYTHNNHIVSTFTDAYGTYSFTNVPDGYNNVYVQTQAGLVSYPANYSLLIPESTMAANFCIAMPQPVNDVAVYLVPVTTIRPGFPAWYWIGYYNNGNTPASGTITLQFDAAKMNLVSTTPAMVQSGNTLTFNYTNLQPFSGDWIDLDFMVLEPPMVELDDILTTSVSITPLSGDANPLNNSFTLDQIATNSWDPNDITVREGEFITEEQADHDLHYTIRFQNIGNADAIKVRIETDLDAKLAPSTFVPIGASHPYTVTRENGHLVFKFENINLAGSQVNEAESHGFISYRIRPVSNIAVGQTISADANIYFDFNPLVATNTVTTTVQTLGNNEFEQDAFVIYPNPASGKVTLQTSTIAGNAAVVVADVLGKTVLTHTMDATESNLDISSLRSGLYLITLSAEGRSVTKKLVVK
jgi:Secretion system C-terminal sorting domain